MIDRLGIRRKYSGFTLIELLIAIVVLSVLAGIAIPAFSLWYPNYRLRSAGVDLYTNFQLTKSKAIGNNREYALVFNLGGGSYQVVSGGADGFISTVGDNVVEKTITLADYGSGVRYGWGNAATKWNGDAVGASITFAGNQAKFTARGTGDNGAVVVQNNKNDRAYAVTSILSGFIRMQKFDGAAWQ